MCVVRVAVFRRYLAGATWNSAVVRPTVSCSECSGEALGPRLAVMVSGMFVVWKLLTGGRCALCSVQKEFGSTIVMALVCVTVVMLVVLAHLRRLVERVLHWVVSIVFRRLSNRLVRSPIGRLRLWVVLKICVIRVGAKLTCLLKVLMVLMSLCAVSLGSTVIILLT